MIELVNTRCKESVRRVVLVNEDEAELVIECHPPVPPTITVGDQVWHTFVHQVPRELADMFNATATKTEHEVCEALDRLGDRLSPTRYEDLTVKMLEEIIENASKALVRRRGRSDDQG